MSFHIQIVALVAGISAGNAAAAPVGFEDAVAILRGRDHGTTAAAEEAVRAEQAARPDLYRMLPSVEFRTSRTLTRDAPSRSTASASQAQVTSELNLFRGGADLAARQAAARESSAAKLDAAAALVEGDASAARLLLGLIEAQQRVAALGEAQAANVSAQRVADERYRRGQISDKEREAIGLEHAALTARLALAQAKVAKLEARVEALAGTRLDVGAAWPYTTLLTGVAAGRLTGDRPGDSAVVAAAKLRAEAAEQRRVQARGDLMPRLDASLSYGYTAYRGEERPDGASLAGALTLTVPLFDRFERASRLRVQVSEAALANITADRVAVEARANMRSAAAEIEAAVSGIRALSAQQDAAGRHAAASRLRYERGQINTSDLIDDVRRGYELRLAAIDAWSCAHAAFVDLCAASGRLLVDCAKPAP